MPVDHVHAGRARRRVPDGGIDRGATAAAVGVRTADGAVLAADARAAGSTDASDEPGVSRVHPTAALAVAGGGDVRAFARSVRAAADDYERDRGEPMSASALATRVGDLVRDASDVDPVLGVADDDAVRVYGFGPDGGAITDRYAAAGDGREIAVGALERAYAPGLSTDTAVRLAARAVATAAEGVGRTDPRVVVAVVTRDGVVLRGPAPADELA